jgi:uncharacterized membrane protein
MIILLFAMLTYFYEKKLTISQNSADCIANAVDHWHSLYGKQLYSVHYIQSVGFPECHKLVLPLGPVPFCFNELVLSLEASFAASIILISQSREDKRDKIEACEHCEVNEKAEEEVRVILDHLAAQDITLSTIYMIICKIYKQR